MIRIPKKPRKPSRSRLVKTLDHLVSVFIRARDGRCSTCGSVNNLTNGHIFTRTNYSTRWDVTDDGNCHCQCWGCNYKHEFDPYPFISWYIKKFGQEKMDELHRRHHTQTHYLNHQLQEKVDELKKVLKEKYNIEE